MLYASSCSNLLQRSPQCCWCGLHIRKRWKVVDIHHHMIPWVGAYNIIMKQSDSSGSRTTVCINHSTPVLSTANQHTVLLPTHTCGMLYTDVKPKQVHLQVLAQPCSTCLDCHHVQGPCCVFASGGGCTCKYWYLHVVKPQPW